MPDSTLTWRRVDGDVVHGLQRLIYEGQYDHILRVRRYRMVPLMYFADGHVTWGVGSTTDLDGLREALSDGTLTLDPPEGTEVSVPGLGVVTAGSRENPLTVEALLADIADDLARLAGRHHSSRLAYDAFLAYAADPTDAALATARERYLAIPGDRRIYFLGDMDQNDVPVRVLLAAPGESIEGRDPGSVVAVTSETREWALEYFREQARAFDRSVARRSADGPEIATTAPFIVRWTGYPNGWPEPPGPEVLQNDYPALVVHGGREYRSVTHAYWALSTDDPRQHDLIAAAGRAAEAEALGRDAPRRGDWADARLGLMGALLRDKFRRHPAMAATLLGTGDARILYRPSDSRYWATGDNASNWMGRLLEVVRSELVAEGAGVLSYDI
ncbi:hypothetical protein Ait01nite_042970 [Actinoplanes italicus]|uniref:Putative NAD-dependent protein-ADP-ribosyltransferase YbiA (DUF1768 family) n=1 Tax=Actinoplanes italicus TaxID=113567 RepID=A0A2T0KC25_9ACTN|nr:NADAR family protein [Actinoplanes italicus]PRX20777.1 putative NAD-dependent protein-ADP-ribosyltransferase YbiA (DUF1768 family) [Actinoplanes italicus]GIE31252.1 hypothetical protein Ait01nite_042970 [Actinoplanes italicus]